MPKEQRRNVGFYQRENIPQVWAGCRPGLGTLREKAGTGNDLYTALYGRDRPVLQGLPPSA